MNNTKDSTYSNYLKCCLLLPILNGSCPTLPSDDSARQNTENNATALTPAHKEIIFAEFPGGQPALLNYMTDNLCYPADALQMGIEGRVIVNFTIDEIGNIVDVFVQRSTNPLLDAEALRLVSAMPQWKPMLRDSKPEAVKYTLPVSFKLPEHEAQKVG